MADIGTDHGHLPTWLVASGQVPHAIAIDDKAAPLSRARARVVEQRVSVEVRLGWGCTPLRAGEAHSLTLAGIGGPLIARILAGAPADIGCVVLQPNVGEEGLRRWLHEEGWAIDAEHLVHDRGRWFMTFRAVPGPTRQATAVGPPDAAALLWGEVEAHTDHDALARRLEDDERRFRSVLARSPGAGTAVGRDLGLVEEARRRLGELRRGRDGHAPALASSPALPGPDAPHHP